MAWKYKLLFIGLLTLGMIGCTKHSPVSFVVANDDNTTMKSTDPYILIDVLKNDIYKIASDDTLQLEIKSEPNEGNATIVDLKGTPWIRYTPTNGYIGTDRLHYCAYAVDPAGMKVGDCADVSIIITNSAPTVDIGRNRTVKAGKNIEITADASDTDGDALTYQWYIRPKGSRATPKGTSATFSYVFHATGLYTVSVEVKDSHQQTATDSVDINVTDPDGAVSVGDLMWEDNDHVCSEKLTWDEAKTYCEELGLGGFDDWRLSHADENNISTAEFVSIRKLPLKYNGEEYDPEHDNPADINQSTRTIIEPFRLITGETDCESWTDGKVGSSGHLVGYYRGQKENFDGESDDSAVAVRCVRGMHKFDRYE